MSADLEIHPYIFCPVYWHLLDALYDEQITHVFVYGGSSAGKTYAGCEIASIEGLINDFSTIVFRKEQTSIQDTIYNDFKEINSTFDLGMTERLLKMELTNGHVIRFRGIDKSGKVKGLKGFRVFILDELDHFAFEDYREMRRRLRGIVNAKVFYFWNPVSEEHWINKNVVEPQSWKECSKHITGRKYSQLDELSSKHINERGDSILIKTTYRDNHYIIGHPTGNANWGRIDKTALNEFKVMEQEFPDDYKVYGLGEWGNVKTGNEYYGNFRRSKHIDETIEVDASLPIHASFDFNTKPYMPCNLYQIHEHEGFYEFVAIDEFCLSAPRNTVADVCYDILINYEEIIARNGIFIYGDASGKNNLPLKQIKNLYQEIQESMIGKNGERYVSDLNMRINKANKRHASRPHGSMGRYVMMNKILAEKGSFPVIIRISPKCKYLIEDLEKVQQGVNFAKLKQNVTENGATFEKYGHTSDDLDYFMQWNMQYLFKV